MSAQLGKSLNARTIYMYRAHGELRCVLADIGKVDSQDRTKIAGYLRLMPLWGAGAERLECAGRASCRAPCRSELVVAESCDPTPATFPATDQ